VKEEILLPHASISLPLRAPHRLSAKDAAQSVYGKVLWAAVVDPHLWSVGLLAARSSVLAKIQIVNAKLGEHPHPLRSTNFYNVREHQTIK
jgi:hypothetical protein